MFAGTRSLTTTFVASPTPVFSTTIVYVIGSPGWSVVPEAGEFDFTIVRTGWPMNVWTGGELTVSPLAASMPWSTIGFGSASGTVAEKVSGGDTSTLFDVAAGNVDRAAAGRRVAEGQAAGIGARGDGAGPLVDDGVADVRRCRRRRW